MSNNEQEITNFLFEEYVDLNNWEGIRELIIENNTLNKDSLLEILEGKDEQLRNNFLCAPDDILLLLCNKKEFVSVALSILRIRVAQQTMLNENLLNQLKTMDSKRDETEKRLTEISGYFTSDGKKLKKDTEIYIKHQEYKKKYSQEHEPTLQNNPEKKELGSLVHQRFVNLGENGVEYKYLNETQRLTNTEAFDPLESDWLDPKGLNAEQFNRFQELWRLIRPLYALTEERNALITTLKNIKEREIPETNKKLEQGRLDLENLKRLEDYAQGKIQEQQHQNQSSEIKTTPSMEEKDIKTPTQEQEHLKEPDILKENLSDKGQKFQIERRGRIIRKASEELEKIIADLGKKIGTIDKHRFTKAYHQSRELLKGLTLAKDNYLKELSDITHPATELNNSFKQQCMNLIQEATPLLAKDLGWGDYLTNLLRSIGNALVKAITFGKNNAFFTLTKSESLSATEKTEQELKEVKTDEEEVQPKLD